MSKVKPIRKVDCIKDNCPMPLIKTRMAIMKAKKGDIIEVIGTQAESYNEIPLALEEQRIKIINCLKKNNKWSIIFKV